MFAGFRRFVGAGSVQALVGSVCVSAAASAYSISTPKSELGLFEHRSNQSRNENSHITLNAVDRLSKKFPFDFGNLSLEKVISVSHCHEAAGDSCCKEPTKYESVEPVPTAGKNAGGSVVSRVVELSTLSFEEMVLKNDKDVFVVFYAPWCGYCKRLFPIWEELAQQQHSPSSVVVSQIDMTQHDLPHVPGVVVRGYPTIYLFKKGHKGTPIEYRGGRDVVSFSAFLTYYTNI